MRSCQQEAAGSGASLLEPRWTTETSQSAVTSMVITVKASWLSTMLCWTLIPEGQQPRCGEARRTPGEEVPAKNSISHQSPKEVHSQKTPACSIKSAQLSSVAGRGSRHCEAAVSQYHIPRLNSWPRESIKNNSFIPLTQGVVCFATLLIRMLELKHCGKT